jgi:hypothetical protein
MLEVPTPEIAEDRTQMSGYSPRSDRQGDRREVFMSLRGFKTNKATLI